MTRIPSLFNLLKRAGFASLFVPLLSFAQLTPVWQRTIGGPDNDYPARAVELANGGVLIGGTIAYLDFTSDFNFTVLSSNGDSIYNFVYDQELPSYARDVFRRANGTCAVVGDVVNEENMETDFQIVTTTTSGHAENVSGVWHTGNDHARDGIPTLDDGAFLVGNTEGGPSAIDFFVVKLDTEMREDWSRRYANIGASIDEANCVYQMDASTVYIAGSTTRSTFPSNQNMYVIKIDAAGDSLWSMEFGDDPEEEVVAMDALNDYQLVMAANYYSDGNSDILVVCMDTSGTICWQTPVGDPEIEELTSDILVADNSIFVLGTRTNLDGIPVILVAAMSFQGDTLWTQTISGDEGYTANSIERMADGDFLICGTTYRLSIPSQEDALLFRMSRVDDVNVERELVPNRLDLFVYPNPFNSTLSISLNAPLYKEVTVTLYDLLGREVYVIHRGQVESKTISYTAPPSLASGAYVVRAETDRESVMRKVVLLR